MLIYIASPYSHEDKKIVKKNWETVTKYVAGIVSEGHVAISPITYGHVLLDWKEMPSDWDFWKNFCLTILNKCDKMIVLKMDGWDVSRGVSEEIEWAKENSIPIEWIEVEKEEVTKNIKLENIPVITQVNTNYNWDGILPKLEKRINNSLYGELGHDGNFDISLSKVSHKIDKIVQDEEGVKLDLTVLDTKNGKVLKTLLDDCEFRPRASGIIREDGQIEVFEVFTFDAFPKSH
jgi:hypothetical protein